MSQQVKKQRELDPAYWIVHENRFGKKVYLYQKPNQSIIIPTHEEIHQFESNREVKMAEAVKQSDNPFNLRTKPPPNLTKAQKQYEQKKIKQEQMSFKKTKTTVHHDVIPSIIHDEVFTECFNCIDKNHELSELKQQKIKLSRQFQQKIQYLKRHIAKLQRSNHQLVQQNQKLKKQCSRQKNPEENYQMIEKILSSSPKIQTQSKISQKTNSSNSCSPQKQIKKYITPQVINSSQIYEADSSQQLIIIDSEDEEYQNWFK